MRGVVEEASEDGTDERETPGEGYHEGTLGVVYVGVVVQWVYDCEVLVYADQEHGEHGGCAQSSRHSLADCAHDLGVATDEGVRQDQREQQPA